MQRSATKSTPSTPNEPPAKKVRLSYGTSAPGTPNTPSDRGTPLFAAAEDKRREETLMRAAETSGETKWVLSFKDPLHGRDIPAMQVRQAGFVVIDAAEDSDDEEVEPTPMRMQFGGGLKKKKKVVRQRSEVDADGHTNDSQNPSTSTESDAESESNSSDPDEDDPTATLIRETKRKVKAKERDARRDRAVNADAPRRRMTVNEDIDIGGLTTLSGGGSGNRNVECYKCHQKGHISSQCPKSFASRGSTGRGRGRGRR
jgi:hypothetical protein